MDCHHWLVIDCAGFSGVLFDGPPLDFIQMLVPCQGADCNFLALSLTEITVLTSWGLSAHAYAYFMSAATVLSRADILDLGRADRLASRAAPGLG